MLGTVGGRAVAVVQNEENTAFTTELLFDGPHEYPHILYIF